MDLTLIAYCGVDCAACPDFAAGSCPGCRQTAWTDDDICMPVECCRRRGIEVCGQCAEFPCDDMKAFYEESEGHRRAYDLMMTLREDAQIAGQDPKAPTMRVAVAEDLDTIHALVQKTIKEVYPTCYEPAVVAAFCRFHGKEDIGSDIAEGKVRVLEQGGRIIATGTLDGHHITRVYVLPELRGKGYGGLVMQALEREQATHYGSAALDASACAEPFYRHLGYVATSEEVWEIEASEGFPATTMSYRVMEKQLSADA